MPEPHVAQLGAGQRCGLARPAVPAQPRAGRGALAGGLQRVQRRGGGAHHAAAQRVAAPHRARAAGRARRAAGRARRARGRWRGRGTCRGARRGGCLMQCWQQGAWRAAPSLVAGGVWRPGLHPVLIRPANVSKRRIKLLPLHPRPPATHRGCRRGRRCPPCCLIAGSALLSAKTWPVKEGKSHRDVCSRDRGAQEPCQILNGA